MRAAIIVTGTPGTGKTTLTQLLRKEGYTVLDVGKEVKEKELYEFYDDESKSYVVDDDKLNDYLIQILEEHTSDLPLILDGHVVQLPPLFVSNCLVLRCSILNLRQRLVERDYAESKVDENIEAEIMEVILSDMLHLYGEDKVTVVSTDGTVEESFVRVMSALNTL